MLYLLLAFFKKSYKIICILFSVFFLSVFLSGCSCTVHQTNQHQTSKIKVVASLFPQYDFAKQVAKDKADVSLLLPPGTESHTFDPSPSDILNISDSDIFLYTGKEMEPWSDKIISSAKNDNLIICNVSDGIELKKNNSHNDHSHDHDEQYEHNFDPHIWLDPTLAMKMLDNITATFCEKDPQNTEYYKSNAENYKKKLSDLDADFKTMINSSKRKSIVFSGRFAHLYFINRYGLNYISAYDNCSTEAEPSVKKISEVINFIKRNNIPTIYYEEFTEPKTAKSISEQTGAKPLKFSTLHNVTKEQLESNSTYIDLMLENLENLRQGLN